MTLNPVKIYQEFFIFFKTDASVLGAFSFYVHETYFFVFLHQKMCLQHDRARLLPRATVALLVVGQLRDTRFAPRIDGAFAGVTKHVYANVVVQLQEEHNSVTRRALRMAERNTPGVDSGQKL